MGKQVPMLDRDGKPIPDHFHMWRCTDGREFQEIERAIEHQLFVMAEKQLEVFDFNQRTLEKRPLRVRAAPEIKAGKK